MKTILTLSLFIGLSAHASRPNPELNCTASGNLNGIKAIEVVPTDLTGQINASLLIKSGRQEIHTVFNSNGSLDDSKILLLEQDTGPFGKDSYYLEKTAQGYRLARYNLCNFYYQEETCPADATPALVEVDLKVSCQFK